jgi:hypothetical protein
LLKVLEGETEESISSLLRYFKERALPDLGSNIKCGNSLIGYDYYDDHKNLGAEEVQRINAFEWKTEFPEVFEQGGFDAVIGNPPYIRMEAFKDIKNYLRKNYDIHGSRSDLYAYFVERGHKLIRDNGFFSMIISNKFIKANYGIPLRKFLHLHASIEEIADFAGLRVFQGATVRTVVLITKRVDSRAGRSKCVKYLPPIDKEKFDQLAKGLATVSEIIGYHGIDLPDDSFGPESWLLIDQHKQQVLKKLQYNSKTLETFLNGHVLWGVKTGLNKAFIINDNIRLKLILSDQKASEIIKPILFGEDVRRYSIEPHDRYLIYAVHGLNISLYPSIEEHLKPYRDVLEKRATKQEWYELQQPSIALVPIFNSRKILYPEIAKSCQFTIDDKGYFSNNKTFILPTDSLFILGLLNSKMAFFYFKIFCAELEGENDRYLEFRAQYVREFPVRVINFSNPDDVARHDRMLELVQSMLDLHKLASAGTDHDKTLLARQIEATDRQIDMLVYELYGLTEEEIGIVEGNGGS